VRRTTVWFLTGALALGLPASAAAQGPGDAPAIVESDLRPWAAHDGVERPFRFIWEVRPVGGPVDVVADRRLLRFEVRRGRRVLRCAHPAAPSRVSEARVRTLRPGDPEVGSGVWREWVDLRMYCTGAARDAVTAGAEVRARYGWPRRGRGRWVARRSGEAVAGLELGSVTVAASPAPPTRFTDRQEPAPLEVALSPTSARTGAALTLRVSVRAREGRERIFVRPDAWSFRVRGPLGDVRCRVPMGGGHPPPELFRRVTRRSAARAVLDADYFCPRGTFELPGVYEITPKLHLPYRGREWGLDAVRGRLTGPPAAVRVTHGERGYVEQIPEAARTDEPG
jgi:hypothetical protein